MRCFFALAVFCLTACGASPAPTPSSSSALGPHANENQTLTPHESAPPAAVFAPLVRVRTGEQTHEPVPPAANGMRQGTLSPEVIRRVVRRHINEIRACYEAGLSTVPALSGRVTTSFVIDPEGHVASAEVSSSTMAPTGSAASSVERCVSEAVLAWAFPAPEGGGSVLVNYPFVLDSQPQQ